MQWVAAGRRHLTAVAVAVVLVLLLIHFSGRGSLAAGRTHASDASVPPPAQQTDVETPPPQRPRKGKCPMVLTGVAKEARASKCAWWQAAHAHFMAEIQAAEQRREGYEVMLYGDSLTEMWRGRRGSKPDKTRERLPGIFANHIGGRWKTGVFGLSGDTSANLEWRLLNGELPTTHPPRVAVVLVGTNDLRDAKVARDASPVLRLEGTAGQAISEAAPFVVQRITAIVKLMRQHLPDTAVLLMALLPRHRANEEPPWEWPNMFTQGLQTVNRELEALAGKSGQRVGFWDCGAPFFAGPEALNASLLLDALHPSPEGADLLAACIADGITQLISR